MELFKISLIPAYIYLKYKKRVLTLLKVSFAITMVCYNITILTFTSPKLDFLLSASRCALKIITTSVIISTKIRILD